MNVWEENDEVTGRGKGLKSGTISDLFVGVLTHSKDDQNGSWTYTPAHSHSLSPFSAAAMSSQTECHLDKLPVELLQNIIDYEPTLASCSRKLLFLGYKHRYKAIQGPKPSWTILGKRLNRRSIRRFFDYLDEILSDKHKASCITVGVILFDEAWRG